MAQVQKYFRQFDEEIKLKRYHENATLAEKRDRVLKTLSEGVKKQREGGEDIPDYRTFNQGSYDVGTGVKPLDGDFDIDVGVEFELGHAQRDPVEVKNWVLRAVDGHTENVEMKAPCVTVQYVTGGEPAYHVDLAVYSAANNNPDRNAHLARGRLNSSAANREWTPSAPEQLTDMINGRHSGEDAKQFRRTIRSLKRWKDENFQVQGHGAPRGIALTQAALRWFVPSRGTVEGAVKYCDLIATRNLVVAMLQNFAPAPGPDGAVGLRLQLRCPVQPFDDVCARMSNEQMKQFKDALERLREALLAAETDPDPHTACATLAKQFGSDFPVPSPEEDAKPQRRAVVSSGNSG